MKLDITKLKIIVTVPSEYVEKIRNAMCEVGAGIIGNYSYCSFSTKCIGTFKPNDLATPFKGEKNKLNYVNEEKLESTCTVDKVNDVILKIRQNHPYEEPSIEIIPLIDEEIFNLNISKEPQQNIYNNASANSNKKNIILITGAVLSSNENSINLYNKLYSFLDNTNFQIYTPIDTMQFIGTDSERYNKAMNLLKETKLIIAEMSNVSTGQGMELQEAANLNIPILVIAKKGSKISGLVKGCKNVKNILYYNKIEDIFNNINEFINKYI